MKPSDFIVRSADIHDILPITLLWFNMIEETFERFINIDKVELDKFSFAMADRLRAPHVFTRVHGYLQDRPYGKPEKIAFCECLYVDPKYRAKKINDQLIESFVTWAEKNELEIEFLTRYDPGLIKVWSKHKAEPYCIVFRRL